MATRDEKGFIHYTQEELQRIPSYEERTEGGAPAGLRAGTLGLLAGGMMGSAGGPGTALAGMAGGAFVGNQVGRAMGAGPGGPGTAHAAGKGGREPGSPTLMTRRQARAAADPLEEIARDLGDDENRTI